MKKHFLINIISLILIFTFSLYAQCKTIDLWNGNIPNSKPDTTYKEEVEFTKANLPNIIKKVSNPTITIYQASKNNGIKSAVVICPGGGYWLLAVDHEGKQIAEWFNNLGVTAIVLKYRIPDPSIMENISIGPLQDVQEAIRYVRRNATKLNIDPNKIGVIGFSAGGHLAATASTLYNDKIYNNTNINARPDFSILIYPVISMKPELTHWGSRNNLLGENSTDELVLHYSNEEQVTPNTPPTFLVHSQDDQVVKVENSLVYYSALKNNSVKSEIHIFERGGHGYGLAPNGGTESLWPKLCEEWLKQLGIIK